MSSCEKCWRDSQRGIDTYQDLLKWRNGIIEPRCTPEEQAGPDATVCEACGRKTCHQHTHLCQVPGCPLGEYLASEPKDETELQANLRIAWETLNAPAKSA